MTIKSNILTIKKGRITYMKFSHEFIGKIMDIIEDFIAKITNADTDDIIIYGKNYDDLSSELYDTLERHLKPQTSNLIKSISVDEGYLEDWYIYSVCPVEKDKQNDIPEWTEGHIKELCNDFIIIPKESLEKLSKGE